MKIYDTEKILTELNRRFAARPAGAKHITITMNEDGNILTLIPCCEEMFTKEEQKEKPFSEHDWILVDGDHVAKTFGGTPKDIAKQIAEYTDKRKNFRDSVKRLWTSWIAHKDETEYDTDAFTAYSDRYKTLFCRRPDGWSQPPITPGYI